MAAAAAAAQAQLDVLALRREVESSFLFGVSKWQASSSHSSPPILLLMRWQFFCTVIGAILVAYGGAWWTGLTSLDERIDAKFAQMDAKFVHMEEKWDTKFDRLEAFLHTTIRHFEEDKRHLDRQYFLARDECRHGCACSPPKNNSS
jgi:hypothetical protein